MSIKLDNIYIHIILSDVREQEIYIIRALRKNKNIFFLKPTKKLEVNILYNLNVDIYQSSLSHIYIFKYIHINMYIY